LLILSVLCEFYVIDRNDPRRDLSTIGLTVLGLVLLAIIFNAISASSTRLAMALPVIAVSTFVIAVRLLDLGGSQTDLRLVYAVGIGLLVTEFALPLSFLPISTVMFALVLTLAAHTLLGIAQAAGGKGVTTSILLEYGLLDTLGILIILLLLGR